ncbi:hypothetical protein San01_06900 [Streptomyces angustmyceticus]|uniref:Uncharacterized protein n=1 Tax=Streptomyces angustmyceticus TaxID=285578 RepID=A0A5J4L202_9ACTN|nr:hypothetical protein San01_06900 [Streptomyces angustmyceticus]
MNGLAQIGAPTSTRSSAMSPTAEATAITTIATEISTRGRCHERHGAEGPHGGTDHEDGRNEDMGDPLMDSGAIRYLIAQLSMMGAKSARAGGVSRPKVKE